jgi:hypothetical protein
LGCQHRGCTRWRELHRDRRGGTGPPRRLCGRCPWERSAR